MKYSMAKSARIPHWGVVFFSCIFALVLNILPLPHNVLLLWPDWITLVIFYWVLILPLHLGVTFGWLGGLVQDIMTFSLLGQHALGKALTGTVASIAGKRFHLMNMVERISLIFILQSINIGIVMLAEQLANDAPIRIVMWESAITTALAWPLVSFLLDRLDPHE